MHLTFGTGIFWIILASVIGETIVHVAKVRQAKAPENSELRDLTGQVAALVKRVDDQATLIEAQEDTIARLEESADFMQRLLHGRDARSLAEPDTKSSTD